MRQDASASNIVHIKRKEVVRGVTSDALFSSGLPATYMPFHTRAGGLSLLLLLQTRDPCISMTSREKRTYARLRTPICPSCALLKVTTVAYGQGAERSTMPFDVQLVFYMSKPTGSFLHGRDVKKYPVGTQNVF